MEVPYFFELMEKRKIEIPEIVARFREELEKLRPRPSVEGLEQEVGDLLIFLLANIENLGTKKKGGFYEKYMKYKLKYIALKKQYA